MFHAPKYIEFIKDHINRHRRSFVLFAIFVIASAVNLGILIWPLGSSAAGVTIIFDLSPKSCKAPDTTNPNVWLDMTLNATIDVSQIHTFCSPSTDAIWWGLKVGDPNSWYTDPQIIPTQILPLNTSATNYTVNLSQKIMLDPTKAGLLSSENYYVAFFCPGTSLTPSLLRISASSPVNIQYTSGGNYCSQYLPGTDAPLTWNVINPFKGGITDPRMLVLEVVNWILNVAAALIVILIIYSGIRFMLAAGRPNEITRGKNILTWALIGFAVVLIGKGFIALIISVLQGNIPTLP
ncbi:MAG: hypothetical protein HYT62_01050 [Candidatus Yanofskybacteria bacterium]|nr:hypothetical protein [Candidatus Yanofskybacteria bacterium]